MRNGASISTRFFGRESGDGGVAAPARAAVWISSSLLGLGTRRPHRVRTRMLDHHLQYLSLFRNPASLNRRLPHLSAFARQPIVFVTTVTHGRKSLLASDAASEILGEAWARSAAIDGWYVGRYVLMPDHIHLFARPALDARPLCAWMQSWKSLTSRRLAIALCTTPPSWQKDYFDRYLRSAESYRAKWDYVVHNPVRQALCLTPTEWPWQGELHDLRF